MCTENKISTAEAVKDRRKKLGLSQKQLSKLTGVSMSTICRMEQLSKFGETFVSDENLKSVIDTLNSLEASPEKLRELLNTDSYVNNTFLQNLIDYTSSNAIVFGTTVIPLDKIDETVTDVIEVIVTKIDAKITFEDVIEGKSLIFRKRIVPLNKLSKLETKVIKSLLKIPS